MFDAGLTAENLRDCLCDLPRLELLGMTLLQNSHHAGFFPSDAPRDTLKSAVIEVIDYGEKCHNLARRVSALTPIPAQIDLWEFAL